MLLDDFFSLSSVTHEEGTLSAMLSFDPQHRIFEGHFPGQPVVPGVCMMIIVRAALERIVIGGPARLIHADHAKFLSPIDPRGTPEVQLELTYQGTPRPDGADFKVVARLYLGDITFFKYQALFKKGTRQR